jgi:histone acetyltransferase (RNA polymerase elongator complex component)
MNNYQDPEEESLHPKKRKKKRFSPYKKTKYHLSKLEEYENYLNNIELIRNGGNLEV